MSNERNENLMSESMREKDYNACLDMILGEEKLSECTKIVFKHICHESLEKFTYDMVIDNKKDTTPDTSEKIIELGADLYHIHTMLNEKLDRCHFYSTQTCDHYLLHCIINEILKRKKDFVIESMDDLEQAIYQKYQETDYSQKNLALYPPNPDDNYQDFDSYIQFLFKKERNGLIDIKSFHHLWSLLGLRRDHTFRQVRPTQDELYIFCVALTLDYDVFNRLKLFITKEKDKEKEKEIAECSESKQNVNFRKNFRGFTNTKRDDTLKEILENIETWRHCALTDEYADFIPSQLLKNVDEKLINCHMRPLTVKTKHGRKLAPKHN
ncbi:MAG: hypothetical protein NC416_01100 [Eubacterium sp.]|nr:hypothetical protein [Eubacterium sp.]